MNTFLKINKQNIFSFQFPFQSIYSSIVKYCFLFSKNRNTKSVKILGRQKDRDKLLNFYFRLLNMPKKAYLRIEIKELIVRAMKQGKMVRAVAEELNVGKSTVSRAYKQYLNEGFPLI